MVQTGHTVVAISHHRHLWAAADAVTAVARCGPARLLTDPSRPVADGAFAGTKPGAFFTESDGQHMATLRAARGGAWTLPALMDARLSTVVRALAGVEPWRPSRDPAASSVAIGGADIHNLVDVDVALPESGFVVVTGVSGSGKSSLVSDVLLGSAQAGRAAGCRTIAGLDRFASAIGGRWPGRHASPQTVATAQSLLEPLSNLFAAAAKADGIELPRKAFAFTSPAGRCETCKGSGRESVAMDILADLSLPCPTCDGRRYKPEVLAVRWCDLTVDAALALPGTELLGRLDGDGDKQAKVLAKRLQRLETVGLGHIALARRVGELSGGEAQRLRLASTLASRKHPALVCLDEPATGLHETDLARLRDVLTTLTDRGDLIVAAEHRTSLIASADWVIDLGPGGGAGGGRIVAHGRPEDLKTGATAAALRSGG